MLRTKDIKIKAGGVAVVAVSLLLIGAGIYSLRPSLGFPVLVFAAVVLMALFLFLGIAVLLRNRFALKAALLGLTIAIGLGALAAYANRPESIINISQYTYLTLCPPSFASIALDNASRWGSLVGWTLIALENAALYAAMGTLLQWFWRHLRQIRT